MPGTWAHMGLWTRALGPEPKAPGGAPGWGAKPRPPGHIPGKASQAHINSDGGHIDMVLFVKQNRLFGLTTCHVFLLSFCSITKVPQKCLGVVRNHPRPLLDQFRPIKKMPTSFYIYIYIYIYIFKNAIIIRHCYPLLGAVMQNSR